MPSRQKSVLSIAHTQTETSDAPNNMLRTFARHHMLRRSRHHMLRTFARHHMLRRSRHHILRASRH